MPSLPNTVGAFSGATLNIKNLDLVSLEVNDVFCDTLTVDGSTINSDTINDITDLLDRTQNITADPGVTTITGDLITTNAIAFTSVNVNNNLVVHGDTELKSDLDVGNHNLVVQHTSERVGINTYTPTNSLSVNGTANITSSLLVGDSVLYATNTGYRVGINTTNPSYSLDVRGTAAIVGSLLVDTNVLYVNANTNLVGINTSNPSYTLDVNGNMRLTGGLIVDTSASPVVSSKFSVIQAVGLSPAAVTVQDAYFAVLTDVGDATMVVDPANKYVGINTGNPTKEVDIRGSARIANTTNTVTVLDVNSTNVRIAMNKTVDSPYTLDVNGGTRIRGSLELLDTYMSIAYPINSALVSNPSSSTHIGYIFNKTWTDKTLTNTSNDLIASQSLGRGIWLITAHYTIDTLTTGSFSYNFNLYIYTGGTQVMFNLHNGTSSYQVSFSTSKVVSLSGTATYSVNMVGNTSGGNTNAKLLASTTARNGGVQFVRLL